MDEAEREALGRRIAQLRDACGHTQESLAEAIGVDSTTMSRWERGEQTIRTKNLARLAGGLGVTMAHLRTGPTVPENPESNQTDGLVQLPEISDYIANDDLQQVSETASELIRLDNEIGAAGLIAPTSQLLGVLRDRLQTGAVDPRVEQDLSAVVGEVAEIAGWFAYDVEESGLVRQLNNESLHWSRLASDRSMELLTLQNASMHALNERRYGEALLIARSVLEAGVDLSPMVRAIFLARRARALALRQDFAALADLSEARSLLAGGPGETDPDWAWWFDGRELDWQEAMARWDLGQTNQAIDAFEQSASSVPPNEVRSVLIHWAHLLEAQVAVGARRDAEASAKVLLPIADHVQSGRATSLVRRIVSTAGDIPDIVQLGRALNATN